MTTRREILAAAAATAAAQTARPIRVALYGTQHSHFLGKLRVLQQSPEYEVAGVHEPGPSARPIDGVRRLSEEELLGDAPIQLVVVECKVWEAIPWGTKVIRAGKHLHLEKPPGDQMAPFRELVEEARRKKLLLQLGYIWRCHQGVNAALEAARRGWLGDVFQVRASIHTDIAPDRRGDLARYRGGMMFELGCHVIDRVIDLLGRPTAVRSWLRHDSSIPDQLADNTVAVFEYDKALAVVSSAARQAGASEHRSFEILGTNGSVLIQPVEPGTRMKVTLRDARGPYKAGAQTVEFPAQARYAGDLAELARALRTGTPLKFSYEHELLLQETVLRACQQG